LIRVATYNNEHERPNAKATIRQFQAAAADGVIYLDRGWQSMIDAMRAYAIQLGVHIEKNAAADVGCVLGCAARARRNSRARDCRRVEPSLAGGMPALVFVTDSRVDGPMSVDLDEDGRIQGVYIVRNPAKFDAYMRR